MTPHFERDLDDPHQSVVTDFRFPTRPLLIAFGGMAGRLGIPPFEFFNVTRHLDVNRVYLRDLSQTWYHAGLPGVSESIDDTACFLRSKIAESGSKRVVVVGNSAGGYAAILFGVLIGADMIHAFSPHTSLHNPDHIRSVKRLLFVQKNFADKYFDLSNLLTTKSMSSRIHIYYNSGNAIDTTHAVHLARLCPYAA
jgi:hypothetical protein